MFRVPDKATPSDHETGEPGRQRGNDASKPARSRSVDFRITLLATHGKGCIVKIPLRVFIVVFGLLIGTLAGSLVYACYRIGFWPI